LGEAKPINQNSSPLVCRKCWVSLALYHPACLDNLVLSLARQNGGSAVDKSFLYN
jgi:hypothetical protein